MVSWSENAPRLLLPYDNRLKEAFLLSYVRWSAGDVTCLATIPADTEAEAHFIAKEDGVIAGIALAEIIFNEVDPSLEVMAFYEIRLN